MSNSSNSSPQRQRREARRTKRFHQRISLVTLLALAVSPSFVALYFTSKSHRHHDNDDHQHASSIQKSSLRLRPPPLSSLRRDRLAYASSSRRTKRSHHQRTQQHQQQPLHHHPPQKELELEKIDSVPSVDDDDDDDDDIENSSNGLVCQTITKQQQQQQQQNTDSDQDVFVVCCARWEYNTDDWWLQHYDYEIQQENATHTCFAKIANPKQLAFLQRVERNQWQQQKGRYKKKTRKNSNDDEDDTEDDELFCARDVQVNQISTGYAAALTTLTRSFAAALSQNRPFQYNKRHDRYHWNFSIRNNATTDTTTGGSAANALVVNNATSHWAYCPTQDMNCFYLPLGQCRPQLGRHDDGFRGKKPPSAGAVAQAAAVAAATAQSAASSNNNNDIDTATATAATIIQQERLEFLWLRRYAFRPRHALRHQLYLFLQHHLTPTHQKQLAQIHAASQKQRQQSSSSISPAASRAFSCTAIHIRRGDVAFGKGRRYAAVQEYLDAGNISHGETIVLLTDDVSTIDEVQEFHNGGNHMIQDDNNHHDNHHESSSSSHDYNWIYVHRPRFLGSQGGFEGFIPSNDPAFEVVAILADMQLASYCPRLVHGKSGFVDLLVEEREQAGLPLQTILLDIQQDKGSQPKLDAQARARQYLQRIRQARAAVVSEQ
jgi:hypothetical protein